MAKLYFRYSSMNAGKSTYLLQVAHNYHENNKKVILCTAGIDGRYGQGKITSRLGLSRDACVFFPTTDFNLLLSGTLPACVLIDEAQFLAPIQVRQLHRWAHEKGVPILCFGIRTDFKGVPFPGAAELLALADDLEEIKTVCQCGKKATMNIRTDAQGKRIRDGDQVLIGGNSQYRQVCASCFYREVEVPPLGVVHEAQSSVESPVTQ